MFTDRLFSLHYYLHVALSVFFLLSLLKSHTQSYLYASSTPLTYLLGFLLWFTLITQVVSGIILVPFFNCFNPFSYLCELNLDSNYIVLLRFIHAHGPSFIAAFILAHLARALVYALSNKNSYTSGYIAYVLLLAVCFLGYAVVSGQLSYWGVTVILNLFTFLPNVLTALLGGNTLDIVTLPRLFLLHFVFPFVLLSVSVLHMAFLHAVSSHGAKLTRSSLVTTFFPQGVNKDLIFALFVLFFIYLHLCFSGVGIFAHPDNARISNALVTPAHIIPEWYYLPQYMALKALPSKFAGLLLLVVVVVFPLGLLNRSCKSAAVGSIASTQLLSWAGLIILSYLSLMLFGAYLPSQYHVIATRLLLLLGSALLFYFTYKSN